MIAPPPEGRRWPVQLAGPGYRGGGVDALPSPPAVASAGLAALVILLQLCRRPFPLLDLFVLALLGYQSFRSRPFQLSTPSAARTEPPPPSGKPAIASAGLQHSHFFVTRDLCSVSTCRVTALRSLSVGAFLRHTRDCISETAAREAMRRACAQLPGSRLSLFAIFSGYWPTRDCHQRVRLGTSNGCTLITLVPQVSDRDCISGSPNFSSAFLCLITRTFFESFPIFSSPCDFARLRLRLRTRLRPRLRRRDLAPRTWFWSLTHLPTIESVGSRGSRLTIEIPLSPGSHR